jgi:hypothetical protein
VIFNVVVFNVVVFNVMVFNVVIFNVVIFNVVIFNVVVFNVVVEERYVAFIRIVPSYAENPVRRAGKSSRGSRSMRNCR